jgi:molybdate transport system substrate-binding protein
MRRTFFAAILSVFTPILAHAAGITVFCPGATGAVVTKLAAQYQTKTGNTVKFTYGTAGAIAKRVASGASGDIIITTLPALHGLAKSGKAISNSIRTLGSMGVGVAVRKGAPLPDISTVAAFKATLIAAQSITFADPAKGGQSGIHIAQVLQQLGIAQTLKPKLQLRPGAPEGLKEVASGKIQIGMGQISEILANKDVVLVGPLPPQIQGEVTFAAALGVTAANDNAAKQFIEFLITPAAQAVFKQAGFVSG